MYGVILTSKQIEDIFNKYDPEDSGDFCIAELIESNLSLDAYEQEDEGGVIIGKEIASTYNESFEELTLLTEEEKVEVHKKLIDAKIETPPKYYVGGM
jgi:hypothetical protein